jgi:hypothetical protein
MPTLTTSLPTLADLAKRKDPKGKIDKIAEILTQTNPILEDMPWMEANDGSGHRSTVRTGLPTGTWRLLNYGVQPEKSTTAQIRDTTGMLESYSEVDKKLVDLSQDKAGFLLSESRAFLEGMNQNMAQTVIYGDSSVNPERFTGIAPRFNTKTAANAQSAQNVLDAGGTGSNNTSIYLICWGENTVHGIYPAGTVGGLKQEETKQETLFDANGGRFEGYRTHFEWNAGLVVRDWRYIVRIANIDVNALTRDGATGANLIDLMAQAQEMLPFIDMGTPVFYANRTVRSFLRRQLTNKSNVWLTQSEAGGKKVMDFGEVPVKRLDTLLNTEARVV